MCCRISTPAPDLHHTAAMDFQLFLPQMRMSLPTIVERVQVGVDAGLGGVALMDHLAPPMAEQQPMWDAMVAATWLGAHTTGTVGHLVLCDAFRHPAVLARQAVSLDHATGGRFELGLGWGSVPDEFDTFGVGSTEPRHRVSRLAESIRGDVRMRLRVEVGRARIRTSARIVVAVTVFTIVFMYVFSRPLLDVYDTAAGQMWLLVILAIFGLGGWMLNHYSQIEMPERFSARRSRTPQTAGRNS